MKQLPEELAGRNLGEFVVREAIGAGGFGAVYRAEQPLLGREAVIKVLKADLRSDRDSVERFLREVKLASRLDHPFAAHIYAFGAETDGTRWIAMELVRGTPLDQLLLTNGPLPPERLLPLLERICEVLHSAHEQGIVHRDVKPANVMVLSRAGRLLPKLLDFGIAKLVEDEPPPPEPGTPVLVSLPAPADPTGQPQLAFAETHRSYDEGGASITRDGAMIGSPLYMAPEQWFAAARADARTDQYALGCLAYQALTGEPPFQGASLAAIANAHARAPLPPLGSDLPVALDAVLRRAMAKRPAERYPSVLDFAAEFRAACGLTLERESLPQLDESARDEALADAPQPIAEAVAAMAAPTTPPQLRDAVRQAVRTAARYLGVAGLACRVRIGAGGSGDSPEVIDELRALRQRGLSDEEWVDLARRLAAPWARRRDAYPLPELVALFWDGEGGRRTTPFEALFAAARAGSEPLEELSRSLRPLAALLTAISFLGDYPLAVVRGDAAERWMGTRRLRRETVRLAGQVVAGGRPLLLDRSACPLLELWPLAQVRPPSPGAADELFLVEGPGPRGAKLVALPLGFERQDRDLWDWFGEHLLDTPAESGGPAAREQSPYRGLAAFTPDDAAVFFGREREAEAFANRLRANPLLAVVGPSGAGKSSFVQAGVLPLLPPEWRAIIFRPGDAPLATLAARLEREGVAVGNLRGALAADPEALGERLRAHAAMVGGTVVLVVDQFEELLTLGSSDEDRAVFAAALALAARSADDPVRVVLTLRDDFLVRAERLPGLRERLSNGMQLLSTPAADDLRRILVEPAHRAGYRFDDQELPDEMVREVAALPGALALLSFTAAKLWDVRDRQFCQLERKAYQAMGGVGGALAQHAEETVAQLSHDDLQKVRVALRNLVTADGTRAVLSRTELGTLLDGGDAVVEKLVAARLLQTSEGADGQERVEIVHEALLAAWPRLVAWRLEDAEGTRLRDQLRTAARQWEERGRPRGLLWRSEALTEYALWRRRFGGRLTASEDAFGAASVADAARGRRARVIAIGAAFALLAAGIAVLLQLNRRKDEAASEARSRLAAFHEDEGRQAWLAGDPLRALLYLDEAMRLGRDDSDLRFLLARAAATLKSQRALLEGSRGPLLGSSFSGDGKSILTASSDGSARLWSADRGTELARFDHPAPLLSAELSRDGARVLTVTSAGEVTVWDVAARRMAWRTPSRAPDLSLAGFLPSAARARFSPDGTRVALVAKDGAGEVRDSGDGTVRQNLGAAADQVASLVWSRDGARIATAGASPALWDARTGRRVAALVGHTGPALFVALSPDGKKLLTGGLDATARVWDADSGRSLGVIQRQLQVRYGAFSPDGRAFFVRGDGEAEVQVWSTEKLQPSFQLTGHRGYVSEAAFSPDGSRLVTASIDGTSRIWETRTGTPVALLVGHSDRINAAAWSPDGARVVTAGEDRSARVWDARLAELEVELGGHTGEVWVARFTSDGGKILTSGHDRTLRIWDAATGREERRMSPAPEEEGYSFWSGDGRSALTFPLVGTTARLWRIDAAGVTAGPTLVGHDRRLAYAAFSPDGATVATVSEDATLRTWDAADGHPLRVMRGHSQMVEWVDFSPDGRRIATGSCDEQARVWSVANGGLLATLVGHSGWVESAVFSADGARLVTASDDQSIRVWSAADGKLIEALTGPHAPVQWAGFSADGSLIASAGLDGLKIWGGATGRLLDSSHRRAVFSAGFSGDSERLVLGGFDGRVSVRPVARDHRSAAEVDALVRCRVPLRIDGERVLPAQLDPSACLQMHE